MPQIFDLDPDRAVQGRDIRIGDRITVIDNPNLQPRVRLRSAYQGSRQQPLTLTVRTASRQSLARSDIVVTFDETGQTLYIGPTEWIAREGFMLARWESDKGHTGVCAV
jgi:hypothetical protein